MDKRVIFGAIVVHLLVLAKPVHAQIGAPAAPAAPAAPDAGAAATSTPAPTPTIWDKLGLTKENCAACKEKCCKSVFGQMLNNMTKPLTFATGGLIPPLCPTDPTDDQLKKLLGPDSNASDAEKVAAQIKADEAQAAVRKAAIRYLGTVDCHYFPEAEGALIGGLRSDRNECVRWEAAIALGKGCCCTKKTVAALMIVVEGKDTDGNPSETSERVKDAAACALQHCTAMVGDITTPATEQPERPGEPPEAPGTVQKGRVDIQLAAYYTKQLPKQNTNQLVDQACRLVAERVSTTPGSRPLSAGHRTVADMVAASRVPSTRAEDDAQFEEAVLAGMADNRKAALAPPTSAK